MSDQPIAGSLVGVAPSVAMGRGAPLLPRRRLGSGALGHGSGGRAYRLLTPLDKGGMGELYLAEVATPGRPIDYVVVKRLLADLLDDEKYVAMFRSEAQVMERLSHQNIVSVYDTPIVDHAQCLALEYVRGRSAQQILSHCEDKETVVPPRVAVVIVEQVLRGLQYAHTYKMADGSPLDLVHRDVSPGNVLISFDGEVKLTDFGIAKSQMSAVSTTVGIVKGKARYLAPEQILGDPASPRSDVFSAAAVLSELLTNIPTFDQATVPKTLFAIVNDERSDLAEQLNFRCPELVQTINRALNNKVENRWETAGDFADALRSVLPKLPPGLESPGTYLSKTFSIDDDPLSSFLARDDVVPRSRLSSTEAATEHGFSAESPSLNPTAAGVDAQTKINERHYQTEVIDRPVRAGDEAKTRSGEDERPVMTQEAFDEAWSMMDQLQKARAKDNGQSHEPTAVVRTHGVPSKTAVSPAAKPTSKSGTKPAPKNVTTAPSQAAPRERPKKPVLPSSNTPTSVIVEKNGMPRPLVLLVGIALGVGITLIAQTLATPTPPTTPAIAPVAPPPLVEADTEPMRAAEITVSSAPTPTEQAELTVGYPKGARVYLDEAPIGRVPVSNIQMLPGTHHVSVIKGKRYRKRYTIDAKAGARYLIKKTVTERR